MAGKRFCDWITKDSSGEIAFSRLDGGVIIADGIYADIEPRMEKGEKLITTRRYAKIPPPFKTFWIEAKSALHPGIWVGASCSAERTTPSKDDDVSVQIIKHVAKQVGFLLEDTPIETGWFMTIYPIVGREKGGGRMEYALSGASLDVLIGPDGSLMSETINMTDAPSLYSLFREGLRLPGRVTNSVPNLAALVLETLAMMNCVNVRQQVIQQPEAVRKAHEKKYRLPMSDYKILTVKGQNLSETAATYNHQHGTHAAPRRHRVRGHFKHFADGRQFWWDSFMRGRDTDGSVAKTYKVEKGGE